MTLCGRLSKWFDGVHSLGPVPTSPLTAGPPSAYLGADEILQSRHSAIVVLAQELRQRNADDSDFAHAAFEWVRDEVAHSFDVEDPRVTLTATEVLEQRVGLCCAKSHLLVALLRNQRIPAGLCYQRLGSPAEGYFVHGLVAVHLKGEWHRQDPRGNKPGVDAQFSLGAERLAWAVDEGRGERDYPVVYESAATEVVDALRAADNVLICALPAELDVDSGSCQS